MYKYSEVYEETLKYFNGDKLAAEVWIDKYCLKDQNNYFELSPTDMHKRIAKEFSRIENNFKNPISEEKIFELLDHFKYIVPGGSPMSGIGNNHLLTSLSNCFVVDSPFDSYPGIMKTEEKMVSVMKRRGGVGVSLGTLRPKDMPTTSVSKKSSGVVLFAERYSRATQEVAQDGRRGALMLSLIVTHPDILDFIEAKTDLNKINGANVSIMITDDFMTAVINNADYEVKFESDKGSVTKMLNSKLVWEKIIYNAWKSAEPGVLFWDTIIKESPSDCYSDQGFKTVSTNPCGEIPLSPADSCRLMAINLFNYVINPFEADSYFDFDLFKEHSIIAQRLMDDLVELEIEKIKLVIDKVNSDNDPEDLKRVELELWNYILDRAIKGRRTGLGITSEGDMLAALGITYASEKAIEFTTMVHKVLAVQSYTSSIILAEERGCFPIWDARKECNNPFVTRILRELPRDIAKKYFVYGRRNISNLTIAPTGSVSICTQTTSGIEPAFMLSYKRRKKVSVKTDKTIVDSNGVMWEEYRIVHHKFREWFDKNWNNMFEGKPDLDSVSDSDMQKIIENSPYHKSTSGEINWLNKVKMQGSIQKWVDHSISVTVNVPSDTKVETVNDIYMEAYKSGCKGCTIYRDGCRDGILSSNVIKVTETFNYNDAVKRPAELECDIFTKTALGKDFTILVGLIEGKPYEIFAFKRISNNDFPKEIKKGTLTKVRKGVYKLVGTKNEKEYSVKNIIELMDENEQTDTRKYSLKLRHGIKPEFIFEQIDKYATITSFDKVIGRVLKSYYNGEGKNVCPECGAKLMMQDGCEKCSCGFSKCG